MSIEISPATLYVVATPIGNLADISQRAIEALGEADIVAAEDTRHSQRLLNHLGIRAQLRAYHEHNELRQAAALVAALQQGQSVALISDAGTPLVSDPGYRLVEKAHELGIRVVPIPGACAAVAAMSVAGLPSDRFVFEGFPPARQGTRLNYLKSLKNETRTLVFYISCHRIVETLADMRDVFGAAREVTLAREISKQYETIRKTSLAELHGWVEADAMQRKGEIVLVVAGDVVHETEYPLLDEMLEVLVDELPVKQAAAIAARISGLHKNDLYKAALKIRQAKADPDV